MRFVEDLCPQGGLEYEEAKRISAVLRAAQALFDGYRAEDLHSGYWRNDPVLDFRMYELFKALEAYEKRET